MAAVRPNKPQPNPAHPDLIVPSGLGRINFKAMGTTIDLLIAAPRALAGVMAARTLFAEWEQCLSRFRADSELSLLNRQAGQPVVVSQLLYDVLTTALEAARATNGLYDPTMLTQITALGYDRSFDKLPETIMPGEHPITPGGGWRNIVLDPQRRTVTLPSETGIDLGGIAKGMAVDASLARLSSMGISPALVNAGGDLALGGLPPASDAWMIAIAGPQQAWTVPLQRGAMATSGIAKRHWIQGAELRHHLLDPRTGQPAPTNLWSVTVVAASCVQAEVAAKVAFILGPEAGAAFVQEQGLAGLFIHTDGTAQAAGAWPLETVTPQSTQTEEDQ